MKTNFCLHGKADHQVTAVANVGLTEHVEEDNKVKSQFPCDEPKQAAIGAMPFSFQQMETETFGFKLHA